MTVLHLQVTFAPFFFNYDEACEVAFLHFDGRCRMSLSFRNFIYFFQIN